MRHHLSRAGKHRNKSIVTQMMSASGSVAARSRADASSINRSGRYVVRSMRRELCSAHSRQRDEPHLNFERDDTLE